MGLSFDLPLFSASPTGPNKVDIYSGSPDVKGMDWKKIHTWEIPKGNETIEVLTGRMWEGMLQFTSTSWFAYDEVGALPVLEYNPATGDFTESLVD